MSNWYTTRIIKPIRIFQTNPNIEFSIYEKTGLKVGVTWKSPYLIYCYREVISNEYNFNAELHLEKLTDDKYIFKTIDNNISNQSIIDVLIMESDEQMQNIKSRSTKENIWKNIEILNSHSNKYKSFTLNKSNNYSFDISHMNIRKGSEKFIFFIKSMYYLPHCFHIKIEPQKISDTTYKVILKQKYCDVTNTIDRMDFNQGVHNQQKLTLNNVASIKFDINCESDRKFAEHGKYFDIVIDNEVRSTAYITGYALHSYASFFLLVVGEALVLGKNKNKDIYIKPVVEGADALTFWYKGIYLTTSDKFYDINDFEIEVFVVGDEL